MAPVPKEKKDGEKPEEEEIEIPKETNVGRKLSEQTTKRVIMLVMSIMISIPFFSIDTYHSEEHTSFELGLKTMHFARANTPKIYDTLWRTYITQHEDIRTPIIYLTDFGLTNSAQTGDSAWSNGPDYTGLRTIEK